MKLHQKTMGKAAVNPHLYSKMPLIQIPNNLKNATPPSFKIGSVHFPLITKSSIIWNIILFYGQCAKTFILGSHCTPLLAPQNCESSWSWAAAANIWLVVSTAHDRNLHTPHNNVNFIQEPKFSCMSMYTECMPTWISVTCVRVTLECGVYCFLL
jgi:hypothetical protein